MENLKKASEHFHLGSKSRGTPFVERQPMLVNTKAMSLKRYKA
tara:strand:+ start:392 stop:520 length:129 start_codon:yes stop_codon:yes gene_type:complete